MKTIYNALIKHLRSKVPALKWIDLNTGQLDVPFTDNKRPPVAYPCLLIDISIDRTTPITDTLQECQATITLTIADDTPTRTSRNTKPTTSLGQYELVADIYTALQGYMGEANNFAPLNRTRQERLRSSAGLFLYRQSYTTTFLDITNQ